MKNMKVLAASLFAAALVAGALTGCGSQAASSASASASGSASSASASASVAASSSASAAAESGDAATDLKAAMAGIPDYKSVTITLTTAGNDKTDEPITNVAKFDLSGETVKSSMVSTIGSDTAGEFIDGDTAVVSFGGEAFKGTVEEMQVNDITSVNAFLETKVGNFDKVVSCVSDVQKADENGNVRYTLTIDPEKYVKVDEVTALYAEMNEKLNGLTISYLFDADGRLVSIEYTEDTSFAKLSNTAQFSDFDSTVVDPAPETDKTKADLDEAMKQATDELAQSMQNQSAQAQSAQAQS